MEEQKKNGTLKEGGYVCTCCGHYGGGSGCNCGCGRWHGSVILRIVIGLLIAMVVFWVGVKIGEVHSQFGRGGFYRGGYGYPGGQMYPGGYRTGGIPPVPVNTPGMATSSPTL